MTWSPGFRPEVTSHLSPIVWLTVTGRGSAAPLAPTTMTVALPVGSRLTAACGISMALLATPLPSTARTYMPGSSTPPGLSKVARRPTEPVVGSTVTSENSRRPGMG
jgi:hypothetical protein